ncbi:carbonic anhydrase [Chamaesiphon minutus]|uniref:carbonic anhydrase n=1 Tax=Chamaesiphon minutus (strain ATCC 27169 / PCC 6605) TaxID=1173020 RepID=K9UJB1_CHAP6|nr:carbonic anhydrase family protein [Chamaesiphon minutus]AFY94895.1 carbonic anhydrase [Chamaesiphon minutus PCC 6605]
MNLVKKYCLRTIAIAILFIFGLGISPLPTLAAESTSQWGYEGDLNPDAWGKISRDFATCDLGKYQSPIDIQGAVTGQPVQIAFNYKSSPLSVVNNGHSIQVNYNSGSTISIDGEEYQLLQFHFHTPSEHKIAGKAAAMEVHFVHRNAAGKLAVVGVMMNEGRENSIVSKVWQAIPPIGQTNKIDNITIDAAKLLPNSKSYYSYIGSLTTPPCSEGVNWTILTTPITISSSQLQEFKKFYPIDARPIHSTNARKIELHGSI